ncbi:hypothetical protein C0995_012122, partial [Termitomyces sp. Mi166
MLPFRKNKPASTGRGSPSASLPTGNNLSGEPAVAPDGHRSLRKQLLEVFTPRSKSKSQASSPLSGTSPVVSVTNLTAHIAFFSAGNIDPLGSSLNDSQTKSSLETFKEVAVDGIIQGLRIAKESADWNPFLKGALGGVVAVVDLVKESQQVSDNWTEMGAVSDHINSLLPVVSNVMEHLQKEFKIIQEMQLHGLIRRGLQATPDAKALLDACKKITEALDDLKLAVMIIIEQDTSLILK